MPHIVAHHRVEASAKFQLILNVPNPNCDQSPQLVESPVGWGNGPGWVDYTSTMPEQILSLFTTTSGTVINESGPSYPKPGRGSKL